MIFKIILILIAVVLIAAGFYVSKRYGVGVVRKKIREFSSRCIIVLGVFVALLLSAVYCYDYVSVILKDALSAEAVDSIRETVKFFFGTTSVFASIKTLLLSCVMLGLLSCITFGLDGIVFMPQTQYSDSNPVTVNAERSDGAEWDFVGGKLFLSYSRYIS